MSRKKTVQAKAKQTKKQTAKKSVVGKTATGKNTGSGAGKTATGNKSGSGRTSQSAKRTPKKAQQPKEQRVLVYGIVSEDESVNSRFPKKFPFWARIKMSKRRTTLVIDEEDVVEKKSQKKEKGFVHREATHTKKKDYEEISPNPDKTDSKPMYLKRPRKLPQRMFEPHNKDLDIPEHLKEKYDKNNNKKGK